MKSLCLDQKSYVLNFPFVLSHQITSPVKINIRHYTEILFSPIATKIHTALNSCAVNALPMKKAPHISEAMIKRLDKHDLFLGSDNAET